MTEREPGACGPVGDHHAETLLLDTAPTDGSVNGMIIAPASLRYAVIDELGRGGMGAVYRARDQDLGREVALKVARGANDPTRCARFLAEARITGQLQHPNIVPVHGCGVDPAGRPWFSMTLVRGRELAEILGRRAQDPATANDWPLTRLVAVLVQACHGVAFAHSRGVVHRDLKPANLMLGSFGEVLVMDWGLGCRSAAPGAADDSPWDGAPVATRDGTVAGTPSYMPPEQARGERDRIGPRSDVYALGAILFELLTGAPPHRGDTATEVVRQAQTGIITWPRRHADGSAIPRDLAAVARRALQANPADRYASVEALRDDLQRWLDHRPVEAAAGGLALALGKFVRRHRVSSAVIVVALCTVLVSLAAGLVVGDRERARAGAALATAAAERARADQGRQREGRVVASAERLARTSDRGLALALIAQGDALLARGQRAAAAGLLDRVPVEQRSWVWHHLRLATTGHGESAAVVAAGATLLPAPGGFVAAETQGRLRWLAPDGAITRSSDQGRALAAVGGDGQRLALAIAGGGVRVLSAADGRPVAEHFGVGTVHVAIPVGDGVVVGDGRTLRRLGVGDLGTWDGGLLAVQGSVTAYAEGASIGQLDGGSRREAGAHVTVLGLARDGRTLAAATTTSVRWWSPDFPTGLVIPAAGVGALAPGNGLLVAAEADGAVTWWDPELGLPVLRRTLPGRGIPTLVWDAAEEALAACAADGTVRIWRR